MTARSARIVLGASLVTGVGILASFAVSWPPPNGDARTVLAVLVGLLAAAAAASARTERRRTR